MPEARGKNRTGAEAGVGAVAHDRRRLPRQGTLYISPPLTGGRACTIKIPQNSGKIPQVPGWRGPAEDLRRIGLILPGDCGADGAVPPAGLKDRAGQTAF
ncbi:hypothetical protein GCM10027256_16850 [Novispirillum itersonii subsp. nipponicum]